MRKYFALLGIFLWQLPERTEAIEAKAKIIAVFGEVSLRSSKTAAAEKALRQQEISAGGIVETGKNSFAKLVLPDFTQVQMGAESSILLQSISPEQTIIVELQKGDSRVKVSADAGQKGKGLALKTSAAKISLPPPAPRNSQDTPREDRSVVVAMRGDDVGGLLAGAADTSASAPAASSGAGAEFIARPNGCENIGGTALTLTTAQGEVSIAAGYSLQQKPDGSWSPPQKIPGEKLALYARNPQQIAPQLRPLEASSSVAAATSPAAQIAQELAVSVSVEAGTREFDSLASTPALAGADTQGVPAAGEPQETRSPADSQAASSVIAISRSASDPAPAEISSEISGGGGFSPTVTSGAQVLEYTVQEHERVVSQQASQQVRAAEEAKNGVTDPTPREVAVTIEFGAE